MPDSAARREKLKEFFVEYTTQSDLRGITKLEKKMRELENEGKRAESRLHNIGAVSDQLGTRFIALGAAMAGVGAVFATLSSRVDVNRQQMQGLVGLAPEVAASFAQARHRYISQVRAQPE